MPYNAESKRAAKAFISEVRARTVCERCGKQPVDFHRVEHETNPNQRVSGLVARGYPVEKIQAEIDRCEAFCRSCHMDIDGRAAQLTANRPFKEGDKNPPKRCAACGVLANPLTRGKCKHCYDADRPGRGGGHAGEQNSHARLDAIAVRDIRARQRTVSIASLAREYGVAWTTIHQVVTRKTWDHIP